MFNLKIMYKSHDQLNKNVKWQKKQKKVHQIRQNTDLVHYK